MLTAMECCNAGGMQWCGMWNVQIAQIGRELPGRMIGRDSFD